MKEPIIIQIPCYDESQPVDSQYYNVNYPSQESFERRGVPKFWEEKAVYSTIKMQNISCRKLKFYQDENHVASVLVNLGAKNRLDRLIEVRLHQGSQWLVQVKPINAIGCGLGDRGLIAYFRGENETIYWSDFALQNDQKKIKEEKQPLIKTIYKFVCQFIYNNEPPGFNSSLEREDVEAEREDVEAILNDYIALNPSIPKPSSLGSEISISDHAHIQIPENIWEFHAEQLKALTKHGCISVSPRRFDHSGLELAVKIANNPLLNNFYSELGKSNNLTNIKWCEICSDVANPIIDLTGIDFTAFFSELPSEAIKLGPSSFSATQFIFDHARFDKLPFCDPEGGAYLNWEKVSLCHASFQGAQLSKMNFTNANLGYAVFKDAKLNVVNLTGAEIADADFSEAASLENITWPLIEYKDGFFRLPKLNWNRDGADFIIQQLDLIGQSQMSIGEKQAWVNAWFDKVLSRITVSEELIKFSVLINEKETRFAYLREKTTFFAGTIFEWTWYGNTDTWRHVIGRLKRHLDLLMMAETKSESNNANYQKVWQQKSDAIACEKIMSEHRGPFWGDVTHTKLYRFSYNDNNQEWSTIFNNTEDTKKLRDDYINQDREFKEKIENMRSKLA